MTVSDLVQISQGVGQLGVGAVAIKAVWELKKAVSALREMFANHEERISKLEDK